MRSTLYARRGLVVWQLVLILLALGIGFFVVYRQLGQRQPQPAEAPVQILRAERDSGGGMNITYRYVVAGQSFEREDRQNAWYRSDSASVKVCYDPGSPGSGELRRYEEPC
ncbi:MAG: DUF3592 domain-containing protein [Gemmatimonadaceae bacterium]